MNNILKIIYLLPIRVVAVIMFVFLAVWTVFSFIVRITNCKYSIDLQFIWRMVNGLLSIAVVFVIVYHTVFRRSSGVAHTMPFIRTIEQIKAEPDLLKEMIMNAFLFFPFGLTMPYALWSNRITAKNRKKYLPVFITVIVALLLSASIELIQHLYNFGNAELSDIIMNTLGAAIGSASYCISQKLLN